MRSFANVIEVNDLLYGIDLVFAISKHGRTDKRATHSIGDRHADIVPVDWSDLNLNRLSISEKEAA